MDNRERPLQHPAVGPLEKAVMTVQETAAYLGCHPNTVYKYIRERGLPCVKLSPACFRIPRATLDDWLRREATGGSRPEEASQ